MYVATTFTVPGSNSGHHSFMHASTITSKHAVLKHVALAKPNGQRTEPARPAAALPRFQEASACIQERERFNAHQSSYRHRPWSAPR